jgi:hypothetical protein
MEATMQTPPQPPPTAEELRRHARMLRRAAGQLEAAANQAEALAAVRASVARMLAPVLQWGQGEQATREGRG